MNFTGLGPYKWKYKIDRPLADEEKWNYLNKKIVLVEKSMMTFL